jgi:bacterioferritin
VGQAVWFPTDGARGSTSSAAHGLNAQSVAAEFAEHAAEEQGHAGLLAGRITQLGGEPDFKPEGLLTRSHSEYVEGETLVDMIQKDLVAERIAIDSYSEIIRYSGTVNAGCGVAAQPIDSYSEIIRYFGGNDPTSRRLMEEILAKEEEHAEDMRSLIERLGKERL